MNLVMTYLKVAAPNTDYARSMHPTVDIQLKTKNRRVYGQVAAIQRYSLETMSAVSKIAKTDEVKSSEVMYKNCFLGGSSEIEKDAILFLEATKQLGTLMTSCQSSFKNL